MNAGNGGCYRRPPSVHRGIDRNRELMRTLAVRPDFMA